jgi:hypothetical protein
MSVEVRADKNPGFVTKGQALDLIAQATASGAPDSAAIGVDVKIEFSSPARIDRMVVTWDTKDSTLDRMAGRETSDPS